MRFLSRRDFLQDSAALAAALAAAGLAGDSLVAAEEAKANARGQANDRLKVAVVGVNGRGMSHVHAFADTKKNNTVVATICEVDEAVLAKKDRKRTGDTNPMKAAEVLQGFAPKWERDIRRVLEDKTIDIVAIATPNHWHALAAIWALQAGKDVYVEKPVSHNVSEGRRIVEAARHFKRICQTGTQSRSSTGLQEAMAFLHAGKLGKVKVARGLCYKRRGSIGKVKGEQPIPKSIDYDLWCGPAPKKPLMRQRLHYDWHWRWDYGNGDLGNQGIHEMDKARWGLGRNDLAKAVLSVGGRFGYVDDGETANTQIVVFDYGDAELIFEVRGLPSDTPYPHQSKINAKAKRGENFVGNIFHCTEGVLVVPSYSNAIAFDLSGEKIKAWQGGEDHFGNFLKAVRSRKAEDLNADIEQGHLSSALCHLGNISYRLGTLAPLSAQVKGFAHDKAAADTLERMQKHLADNMVPLDKTQCHVGRKLMIDTKTERFVGDKEADQMLTREYRKGFEVPAKIG